MFLRSAKECSHCSPPQYTLAHAQTCARTQSFVCSRVGTLCGTSCKAVKDWIGSGRRPSTYLQRRRRQHKKNGTGRWWWWCESPGSEGGTIHVGVAAVSGRGATAAYAWGDIFLFNGQRRSVDNETTRGIGLYHRICYCALVAVVFRRGSVDLIWVVSSQITIFTTW